MRGFGALVPVLAPAYLLPLTSRIGVYTTPKFLFRDRRGAASAFRDRNRAAIRYDFRGGAKAIQYSAGAGSFCLQ